MKLFINNIKLINILTLKRIILFINNILLLKIKKWNE